MSENHVCTCPLCNREVSDAEGLTGDERIISGILDTYKRILEKQESCQCPRCGYTRMTDRNASSRQFEIDICSECGTDEAVRAANDDLLPASEWWIVQQIFSLRTLN